MKTKGSFAIKLRWILFVASRYIFRRRGSRSSSVLAVLGIGTGVLALIVIIAVMNGFQLGFVENILEISSCHLRMENCPPNQVTKAAEVLRNTPGIQSVLPFSEFQGLIRGRRGGQQAVLVRGVPPETPQLDRGLLSHLEFEKGSFNLDAPNSILLGSELAKRIGASSIGDEVVLFSITGILSGGAVAEEEEDGEGIKTFTVSGIFRCGFYEYDTGWGFVNIASTAAFTESSPVLGMKIKNRFQDRRALELARRNIAPLPGFEDVKFSSWRDFNRSFFGALRTEKLFMFILVGLIFIVVGLNIFQSQRRSVLERREEIGLLRAVGGGEWAVRLVFVCDGALIGLTGAIAGLIPGLFIASHITQFFTVIESIANFFVRILNFFAELFGAVSADDFAVFPPAVFYIKEIPSRIIGHEVVIIVMFGILSALAAAWFASGKASRIRPAEVLRYE